MATKVGVVFGQVWIVKRSFAGRVVGLVVVIEWSDLERLRDFTVLQRDFDLRFDQIDFGCSSTDTNVRPRVVFTRTGASGKSLTGEVREDITLGSSIEGGLGRCSIGPGLIRECSDITRGVCVSMGQRFSCLCGMWFSRPCAYLSAQVSTQRIDLPSVVPP